MLHIALFVNRTAYHALAFHGGESAQDQSAANCLRACGEKTRRHRIPPFSNCVDTRLLSVERLSLGLTAAVFLFSERGGMREKRSIFVPLRVTPQERAALEAAAVSHGGNVSEAMRLAIRAMYMGPSINEEGCAVAIDTAGAPFRVQSTPPQQMPTPRC